MIHELRIGTRKSPLAMYQTNLVAHLLGQAHPELTVSIVQIETKGDLIQDVPLPKIGAKGLFTQEIEDQLRDDRIDLAVHSLKDLPSRLPKGLCFAGSPARAVATDAFISTRWNSINELPLGAIIATGSVRRRAQLMHHKPHITCTDLRGNIDTRLRKLDEQGWDGIIMATAALKRLGCEDLITEQLDPLRFVPAVGQGAIGIEIREGRDDILALLDPIFDDDTMLAVSAERHFMSALEGGCSAPVAAYASKITHAKEWRMQGWVSDPTARTVLNHTLRGACPLALAKTLTDAFLELGARTLIRS